MNATDASNSEWSGFGLSILLGTLLFVGSFVLVSLLRRRLRYIYESRIHGRSPDTVVEETTDGHTSADPRTNPNSVRDLLQRKYPIPEPFSNSHVAWILDVIRYDEQSLLRTKSADAVVYIWFLKFGIIAFSFFTFLGASVLIPIDYVVGTNDERTTDDPQYTDGLGVISMANLSSGSDWLLAHLVSVVCNTAFVLALTHYFWRRYRQLRTQVFQRKDIVENYSLILRDVPKRAATNNASFEGYMRWLTRHYGDDVVVDARLGRKTVLLKMLVEDRISTEKKLEHATEEFARTGKRPKLRHWPLFWRHSDAINHWSDKTRRLQHVIDNVRRTAADAVIPAGVVTFESRFVANQLGQVVLHRKHTRLNAVRAIEPAGVYWWGLRFDRTWRIVMSVVVGVAVFFLTFFWFIPVSVVAGLANLDTLAELPGFHWTKGTIEGMPTLLAGFLQGLLPAVILIILLDVLPPVIIRFFESHRGLPTHAAVDRAVFKSYFAFQVFNVLLFISVAGSVLHILEELVSTVSASEVIRLLGTTLPQQSSFFINFIVVKWGQRGLQLLRPGDILTRWWKNRRARTGTECREVNSYIFNAPVQAARDMLIFYIGLTYSSMSPLIAPCTVVYFLIAYFVTKHNFIAVYTTPYTDHGRMFSTLLHSVLLGLILYHSTMLGAFSIKVFPQGVALTALVAATIIFWVFIGQKYMVRSNWLALNKIEHESENTEEETTPEGRKVQSRIEPLVPRSSADILLIPRWHGAYTQPELFDTEQDALARQYEVTGE